MSEKFYGLLLKLYPDHFRRKYGDEALRLVRDRARSEKGILSGLRLWVDLLVDLAKSLPREYGNTPTAAVAATRIGPSFQLLDERSLNPMLLGPGVMVSAFLFWACTSAVVHSRSFAVSFRAPLSLQGPVQRTSDQARYPHKEELPALLRLGKADVAQVDLRQIDSVRDITQVNQAQGSASAYAGERIAAEHRPAFQVVSIRRHTAENGPPQAGPTADGFRSIGLPMSDIFQRAYSLPNQSGGLIAGAPGWLSDNLYDMVAKIDAADLAEWQKPSAQQAMLRDMLRTMLAQRCEAVVHYGIKELVIDHVERPSEN